MTKDDYLLTLSLYQYRMGVSSKREYYKKIGNLIRTNQEAMIPSFELENPFLTAEDRAKLKESTDENTEDHFASQMIWAIHSYVEEEKKKGGLPRPEIEAAIEEEMRENLPRKEIQDVIEEQLEGISRKDIVEVIDQEMEQQPRVIMTSINGQILDTMNGFAVVKEEQTGKVHMFYHEGANNVIKKDTMTTYDRLRVDSGYYVNFEEYVNKMLEEIAETYPDLEEMIFVKNGEGKSLDTVLEEVLDALRRKGAIRFGQAIQTAKVNSYKDLVMIQKREESYKGESLTTGLYVQQELLKKLLREYQLRITTKKPEENSK